MFTCCARRPATLTGSDAGVMDLVAKASAEMDKMVNQLAGNFNAENNLKFTAENKQLLSATGFLDKTLVNLSGLGCSQIIEWQQQERCGLLKCEEVYNAFDYTLADGAGQKVKVFISKDFLDIHGAPQRLSTSGLWAGASKQDLARIAQKEGAAAQVQLQQLNSKQQAAQQDPKKAKAVTKELKGDRKAALSQVLKAIATEESRFALYFGYVFNDPLPDKSDLSALYFVIHDKSWNPFQHRFRTSNMLTAFHEAAKYGANNFVQNTITMSIVPLVAAGAASTIASAASGVAAVAKFVLPNYLGHRLRRIG